MTPLILALDGEGYTTRRGEHRYVYLAASDASGSTLYELSRPCGVTPDDVFDFLLSLPRSALLVGYSLSYDLTKWIEGCGRRTIYDLTHPELREGAYGPPPICWRTPAQSKAEGYLLNLVATRFTLSARGVKHSRRVVWDVFRFYQCALTKALTVWKVGTAAQRSRIARMKAKRPDFGAIGPAERAYCQLECQLTAKLVSKLLASHERVGLELSTFFGPGSTATRMFKLCEAKRTPSTSKMRKPIDCAFFGGRFEQSRVGPVQGPVWSYDIASAYPYALANLPCMLHGRWRKVVGAGAVAAAIKTSTTALVSFRLDGPAAEQAWGALPHRLADGNIVWPLRSAGGWAWLPELQAAQRLQGAGHVTLLEAWIFKARCKHGPPFKQRIERWYADRLQWGKTGRGLVLKLGMNSMYGKSAQSVGRDPPFRDPIRAGLITATTRAMILDAIGMAKDPASILSVQTDGIETTERLALPGLGTKRLGAWEESAMPKGVFLLRPGLRFSLDLRAAAKATKARGIGVKTLHANRQRVLSAWQAAPLQQVHVQQPALFWGARRGVYLGVQAALTRHGNYGRWIPPEPRRMGYEATPKRAEIGPDMRLGCWELPTARSCRSVAYSKAPASPRALDAMAQRQIEEDQGGVEIELL